MSWGKPRERAMPLVPQPFSGVAISRQSVFFGSRSMADRWSKFCPNLNILQYIEPLSDKKKTELDQRAAKLYKRAIRNQLYKASEFCWEVSAWNDVFGLLYDDERFRVDKRPYEFLETDDAGKEAVKKRIPDATIGLKSYDDFYLKRGYVCSVSDCEEDHSTMQPDKRLSEHDLQAMMYDPECGLVVDGVWGKTELLFPFAVTYLAMLDDLARNPNNVAEYQTEESSKYQLFAFASCGSYWQVFMVWNMLHDCEGDVKEFSRAFDLICIVDQIQDYAVNHHRPFVMNHLEAWHARHQKTLEPCKKAVREINAATAYMDVAHEDSDISDFDSGDISNDSYDFDKDSEMGNFDSDDSGSSSYGFDELASLFGFGSNKPAEWLRLKEQSKNARHEMANETRKRNRSLLKIAQAPKSAKDSEQDY
ncbi:hypothetical protein G7Y89_g15713 [Cudoniella acicularis]|uniref:Uncharacterized protein n=1 Tax=Cudoniella acicularis TaxID=354080 RepID=A0A8H4QGJ9_9HELO|nr:hypothetical protein G7Y89_g15713 [Cudoniella acicularis]